MGSLKGSFSKGFPERGYFNGSLKGSFRGGQSFGSFGLLGVCGRGLRGPSWCYNHRG